MKGELVYEYGKNPVNWGRLDKPDFSNTEKNVSCGEEVAVDFRFGKGDVIEEIGFEAEGRMITIAAMSMLSEVLEGNPLGKVEEYHQKEMVELLEVDQLSPRRLKSAMLGLLAVKNAYRKRNNLPLLDFGDLIEDTGDSSEDDEKEDDKD